LFWLKKADTLLQPAGKTETHPAESGGERPRVDGHGCSEKGCAAHLVCD